MPPGGQQAGAHRYRLPPADAHAQADGQPRSGGGGDLPLAEDHGQGAECSRALLQPAFPRAGEPPEQAAHAFRSAGIRLHRAGCRYRPLYLPGRLL